MANGWAYCTPCGVTWPMTAHSLVHWDETDLPNEYAICGKLCGVCTVSLHICLAKLAHGDICFKKSVSTTQVSLTVFRLLVYTGKNGSIPGCVPCMQFPNRWEHFVGLRHGTSQPLTRLPCMIRSLFLCIYCQYLIMFVWQLHWGYTMHTHTLLRCSNLHFKRICYRCLT